MKNLTLLALSGSLRKKSYNTALNEALCKLAPESIHIKLFNRMQDLPLFNPDLESDNPESVRYLKTLVQQTDGLIISSPEYAHGISGVMKNAFDWLVSGHEFVYKPIMLLNTSPRASHAQLALREVIKTMSGIIVEESCISVPLLGSNLDSNGIIHHPEISKLLQKSIQIFCKTILHSRQDSC